MIFLVHVKIYTCTYFLFTYIAGIVCYFGMFLCMNINTKNTENNCHIIHKTVI